MKKCWDYFITHGITKAGAAGLLGNLQAESGVRPNILEKSKVSKVGMNSEEYIRRTNDGTYKNFCIIELVLDWFNGLILQENKIYIIIAEEKLKIYIVNWNFYL
jgi:hypothetical protein